MKRALDVLMSVVALIVLSPVLLVIAVLVRVFLGRPVLFTQRRPGLHGALFTIYKFRTMTDDRDDDGQLLADDQRLTLLGRFLRSTSLDELPELFNVLRGDMSLVGPRPLLIEYLDRYSPRQALRHDVRPGLTGWSQVNGRNSLDWDEKLEMDAWYVEHQSLLLDLRVLLATIRAVLSRQGVANHGHATMPPFLGPDVTNVTSARFVSSAPIRHAQ